MSIVSTKANASPLAYRIASGRHDLLVDEPESVGGADVGPTPHDLFDAALAACTSITVTLYAQRKGWPLTNVRVEVVRDDSEERQGRYRLRRKVHFEGDLEADQVIRLLEIADKCPIHKLMHAQIDIQTESV